MKKNILIYSHQNMFMNNDGGIVVMFNLAYLLEKYGENVRIYINIKNENHIFNNFYNNDFPIDDNCVVIYCEGTQGNPLNAKNVVRWMLSKLGQNVPNTHLQTWGTNELVYYFNSETKFYENPNKIESIYKLLNCIYINPYAIKTNFGERNGVCYTIRKALNIHKKKCIIVHPPNSFEIKPEHSQMQCIEYFNKYEWFLSYDSLTFLIVIAALCGCIPVIYKVDGMNKQQWIETTFACKYLKSKGLDNLYGIAYGREDMEYAKSTLHLVKEQWDDIINYCKEKTVLPFIEDIQNFENMQNTIKNNYII